MTRRSLAADDLVVCHYIICQQKLCAKSLQLRNVMSTVTKCIQLIKAGA